MLTRTSFIGLASLIMLFAACKKEGCTDETATNFDSKAKVEDGSCLYPAKIEESPCGEHPFCMTFDGEFKGSDEVELLDVTGGYRIYWHEHDPDNDFFFDFFGSEAKTYPIDTTNVEGTAAGKIIQLGVGSFKAVSGKVEIDEFSLTDGISGSFELVLSDGREITNGHFYNVLK